MRRYRKLVPVIVTLGLLVLTGGGPQATGIAAAQDGGSAGESMAFIKIAGIKGESMDARHRDEIEILSWSWGETNQGAGFAGGGGGGAGKVTFQDMHLTTRYSKASPQLFLACASGQMLDQAVLTFRKAGGDQQEYLKIELKEILVTSYQTGGPGDEVPTDQISLNFTQIKFEYTQQKPDGTAGEKTIAGWNIKENKKV